MSQTINIKCPKCGGIAKYQKGWDIKKRQQSKGGTRGQTTETGQIIRISLFKCQKCMRLTRKGKLLGTIK